MTLPIAFSVMGMCLFLSLSSSIKAQARQSKVDTYPDSLRQLSESGYTLLYSELNQGLMVSPLDLLKGRIPGLRIYKRGSDPNGEYSYQLRGVSTFQSVRPLFVVDGVIMNTDRLIDPADIVNIRVLKDLAALSKYGSQGAQGVIEINTFDTGELPDGAVVVDISSKTAFSSPSAFIPVMNREQYLAVGGNDLGGNTNWQELASRNALSLTNNISVQGKRGNTMYAVSGGFRNVEGILLNSGFERINGRAQIQHKTADDRLSLKVGITTARQETDFSF